MTVREWCNFNAPILKCKTLLFVLREMDRIENLESLRQSGEVGRAELTIPEGQAVFGKYEVLGVYSKEEYYSGCPFVLNIRAKYWKGKNGKLVKHKEGDPGDG